MYFYVPNKQLIMKLLKSPTFKDNRGSYTPIQLDALNIKWLQCSISYNQNKYTFRGMHYQENPPQTKYIKVVKGSIIDFIYDLKTNEVDYIKVDENSAVLVDNTKAHGFITLEPETIVAYLVEGEYNPNSEHSIVWSTIPEIESEIYKIIGDSELIISEKDSKGK
jgi:dTDP-4-dehydrorhamnose 3,5-epimerase